MMLRWLWTVSATCLSVASFATALFVPDTQGNSPRPNASFIDARSLQHDALAVGLDAAPGAARPTSDNVRFVVAPLAVPQFIWPARWPPDPAPANRAPLATLRPGGINALVRIDGVTADVGNMSTEGRYRPAELAGDLRSLPPLAPETVAMGRAADTDAEGLPLPWFEAPGTLVTATLLLLAFSMLIAGALLAHGRPGRPR